MTVFVSDNEILNTLPSREERDPDKETEGPPQVGYEGDGGVGPLLSLLPHHGRLKLLDESEV